MTPHGTLSRYQHGGCRCAACRAANAECSRRNGASRRWKQKQRGTCRVCGTPTGYNGRGKTVSDTCRGCTQRAAMWPQAALDHIARLYEAGQSTYAIAERVAPHLGPSAATTIASQLSRRTTVTMRPRGGAHPKAEA